VLIAGGIIVALGAGGSRGEYPVQVGGHKPGDLLRAASTPVVAVNPIDSSQVLLANRVEAPRFGCSVFVSADGGKSWQGVRVELPRRGERCYAPQVAYTTNGQAHLVLTMLEGRGNEPAGVYLYRSTEGGMSFGAPRRILPPFSFQTALAPGPDGSLYVAWLSGSEFSSHATFGLGPPPNPINVAKVGKDGSLGQTRRASSPRGAMVGGPTLAIGPEREIYLLYWDYRNDVFDYYAFPGRYGGHFRLMLAASHDGGRSFDRHVVERRVVPARRFLVYLPPLPSLTLDSDHGTLYASWEDGRGRSSDVLLRRSSDAGANWTAPVELFASDANEHTPTLLDTSDGRLVALAYRISAPQRVEVAVRVSTDGARSFTAPVALTTAPFSGRIVPRIPNHPDQPELGSRLGLASGDDRVLSAWADARTGSRAEPKVDVMLAPVPSELPSTGPLSAAPRPSPPRVSQAEMQLRGECSVGPHVDSRDSSLELARSFFSALGAGERERAYSYLDPRWRHGEHPVRAAHSFDDFEAQYASLTCARVARLDSYDRSEDGKWNTIRAWVAARRGGGRTKLMIGNLWTHSDTARAPWSLMGFWTREVPAHPSSR
jgi:hypothetical protein